MLLGYAPILRKVLQLLCALGPECDPLSWRRAASSADEQVATVASFVAVAVTDVTHSDLFSAGDLNVKLVEFSVMNACQLYHISPCPELFSFKLTSMLLLKTLINLFNITHSCLISILKS